MSIATILRRCKISGKLFSVHIGDWSTFFCACRQKKSGGFFKFDFYWCIGTVWGWIFVENIMVPVSFCYIERMFFRPSEEYFSSGLLNAFYVFKGHFERKLFFPKRVRFWKCFQISSDKVFNLMSKIFPKFFKIAFYLSPGNFLMYVKLEKYSLYIFCLFWKIGERVSALWKKIFWQISQNFFLFNHRKFFDVN